MKNIILILIIFCLIYYINKTNTESYYNIEKPDPDFVEQWKDLPFNGLKDITTYNNINTASYSRKNLPIYYPISSPLENNYSDNINLTSSAKLSLFRNILRQVYLLINQSTNPIIFNYVNRPIEQKTIDPIKIKTLSNMIISLINKFGNPIIMVKFINTQNEIHEETTEQSRIIFDTKLNLSYTDSENLGKKIKPDLLVIQSEFIFEKINKISDEDQFFNKSKITDSDFKIYLSKIIVIGSEHDGFLSGRYQENKIHTNRN